MELQTIRSDVSARNPSLNGNCRGIKKPRFFRKLKTLTEFQEEHERRQIVERYCIDTGRPLPPPINKWKYVEIESCCFPFPEVQRDTVDSHVPATNHKEAPLFRETDNVDELFERRALADENFLKHHPENLCHESVYNFPSDQNLEEEPEETSRDLSGLCNIKTERSEFFNDNHLEDLLRILLHKFDTKSLKRDLKLLDAKSDQAVESCPQVNTEVSLMEPRKPVAPQDSQTSILNERYIHSYGTMQGVRPAGPIRSVYDFSVKRAISADVVDTQKTRRIKSTPKKFISRSCCQFSTQNAQ